MKEYKKNCLFCAGLGTDGGNEYGDNSFPVCEDVPGRDNLKSFPFKKEQKCHRPFFWSVLESDKEMIDLYDKDDKELSDVTKWESYKLFVKRYLKEIS